MYGRFKIVDQVISTCKIGIGSSFTSSVCQLPDDFEMLIVMFNSCANVTLMQICITKIGMRSSLSSFIFQLSC